MRKETKVVEGIGKVTVDRPNPKCLKEIKEPRCGYCTWSLTDKDQYVGEAKETWLYGEPWSLLERKAVKVPAFAYAKFKEWALNSCKKSASCGKDVDHWRIKLDSLDSIGDGFSGGPKP